MRNKIKTLFPTTQDLGFVLLTESFNPFTVDAAEPFLALTHVSITVIHTGPSKLTGLREATSCNTDTQG